MKTRKHKHISSLMAWSGLLLILALGCLSRPGYAEPLALTYENWAQGFFTHNCLACHNSNLTGSKRFGAPVGVNFDSLDKIRALSDRIRARATGPNASMPPAGVVWWWDRENLAQWLDAGMPGENSSLTPVKVSRNQTTLYYQSMDFDVYKPWQGQDNERVLHTSPDSEKDTEVPDYSIGIVKQPDGKIVMTWREWEEEGASRKLDYNPPVPIFLGEQDTTVWSSTILVRERQYQEWRLVSDKTWQEQWQVSNQGIETIDNGVVLPLEALQVLQRNVSQSIDYVWWYHKGLGIVRRETRQPSPNYDLGVTTEYFVDDPDDPLSSLPYVESASQEWMPFTGRWGTNYGYHYEVQHKGIANAAFNPTPSPTTEPPVEATQTPVPAQATMTPVVPGLPSPLPTATRTASPTRTPTITITPALTFTPSSTRTWTPPPTWTLPATWTPQSTYTPFPTSTVTQVLPTATPTEIDVMNPKAADINQDDVIDEKDLMLFIHHWHGLPDNKSWNE